LAQHRHALKFSDDNQQEELLFNKRESAQQVESD
jgi:hypothetical protein